MSFLRGFSIAMGANITVFALSFLNNKLIYLFLDDTDNGLYFLVMRLSLLCALFFGDWMRLSSMNIAGGDKRLIPSLSANGFWYSIVLGAVLAVASIALNTSDGSLISVPYRFFPAVLAVGILFVARNNWQSLLLVEHRMTSYGLTFVLWGLVFLGLDAFFLVIMRYGLHFVIASLIAASCVSAVWAFTANARAGGHSFRASPTLFGRSARIGSRAWIAVLGMYIMTNIHVFSIGPLSGSPEKGLVMVALFSVGFRIFNLFQRGSDVAGTVLYSHVVQQGDSESSRMTMLVARNALLVSLVFAFIGAAAGKAIILVIASPRYMDAYIPLLLMLPGIVAINTGSVINNYYWGKTYPLPVILAPFAAALVGFASTALLLPKIGVSGAALSFSIMSLLWFMYIVRRFSADSGFGMSEILVPRISNLKRVVARAVGAKTTPPEL
ncbi:MAG: hypothetical protein J7M24_01770 [Candidatus Latescibacteria bacterium]|nr:hypothetical protein [Candidatus Latescibacterota bacterium]